MQPATIHTLAHLLKQSRHGEPKRFVFFLGAGASDSSGIPVASWMELDFKQNLKSIWKAEGQRLGDFEKWVDARPKSETVLDSTPEVDQRSSYVKYFEAYQPTQYGRMHYLKQWMQAASPGWGYFCLAQLIAQGYVDTVVTTNFDDLIYEACTLHSASRPRVHSAANPYTAIESGSSRPTIIKLHGDFLYSNIRTTSQEMQDIESQLMNEVAQLFQRHEIVVLGYSGTDKHVMKELFAKIPKYNAVYWCTYKNHDTSMVVEQLAKNYSAHWFQIETDGFDDFMDEIVHQLGFSLPGITDPIQALIDAIPGRIEGADSRHTDDYLEKAILQLKQEEGSLASAFGRDQYEATPYLLRLEAMYARRKGNYDEARDLYKQLTGLPKQATCEVLIEYAVTLELMGEYLEATKQRPKIEANGISSAEDLGNYGWLLANLGECEKGVGFIEQATKKAPGLKRWRTVLVMVLSEHAKIDKALMEAEYLVKMYPHDGEMWAWRSTIWSLTGRYERALEDARQAVSLSLTGFAENLSLASALSGTKKYSEAVEALDQVRVEERGGTWYRALGHFQMLNGDSAAAVESLRCAIGSAEHKMRPKTMVLHCIALLANGDTGEAELEFASTYLKKDKDRIYRPDDALAFALCELGVGQIDAGESNVKELATRYSEMQGLLLEYEAFLHIMEGHGIEGCKTSIAAIKKAVAG